MDCRWGDWENVGECSEGCGRGKLLQTRNKTREEAHGGACDGTNEQEIDCELYEKCKNIS